MLEFKLNCVSKEAPEKGVFRIVNIDTNGMSLMAVIRLIEKCRNPPYSDNNLNVKRNLTFVFIL